MSRGGQWLQDYDFASSKADEALAAINERERQLRSSDNAQRITSQVRRLLNELAMLVEKLESSNNTSGNQNHITDAEFSRRQNLVSTLKGRKDDLQRKFGNDSGGGGGGGGGGRGQLFGGRESGDEARKYRQEPDSFQGLDSAGVVARQQTVMREQDAGLDLLAQSIARQKQMGMSIGNEIDDQNDMLDDLGDAMDNTERRLNRETAHVVRVTEKAKSGGYMCCICLLILAIIAVFAIP